MKILYLFATITLFSCWSEEEVDLRPSQQNPMDLEEESEQNNMDTLTYLALGDSYTIGESVEVSERWPLQLAVKLQKADIPMGDPKIIARTGWTTNELMSAIKAAELTTTFDLVSLLIGVNNQYRGYPISQQEEEFELLLQQAIAFAGDDTSRVFVVSIPDWGVTPFAEGRDREEIAEQIDAYNLVNFTICQKYGVQYFNITPISREATTDESLVAMDGLHPSGMMYTEWVKLIYPWVSEIFAE